MTLAGHWHGELDEELALASYVRSVHQAANSSKSMLPSRLVSISSNPNIFLAFLGRDVFVHGPHETNELPERQPGPSRLRSLKSKSSRRRPRCSAPGAGRNPRSFGHGSRMGTHLYKNVLVSLRPICLTTKSKTIAPGEACRHPAAPWRGKDSPRRLRQRLAAAHRGLLQTLPRVKLAGAVEVPGIALAECTPRTHLEVPHGQDEGRKLEMSGGCCVYFPPMRPSFRYLSRMRCSW